MMKNKWFSTSAKVLRAKFSSRNLLQNLIETFEICYMPNRITDYV